MFPKRKFREFCNKHNINVSYWTTQDAISIPFSVTNIEHITSKPLNEFIFINFKRQLYNETKFLYQPFKRVYNGEWDDDGDIRWHNYISYGKMTVPLPLNLYNKNDYIRLFTNKTLSPMNTRTTTIPFNTLEQLEHLYTTVYPKLNQDIKDFYNSEYFKNTQQTYNNTMQIYKEKLQTLKNLKKGAIDLLSKSYNITKKKAEIEDEFTI